MGLTYRKIPGLINSQLNESENYGINAGLVLASNISENIDFTFGYSGNFNLVENSLQPELNDNYLNSVTTASLNWIFRNGFVFRTQLNYQRYDGLSEGFNDNYIIWNASIGRKFFKKDQGEISISAFDLLKQNRSIQRNVTETYIEDVTTQVLQQYFMINFVYTLRNFRA